MKKVSLLSILNLTLIIVILIFGIDHYKKSQKQTMAYVDNVRLFNGFNMVKDIKTIEEKKINDKARQLDSLSNLLQGIADNQNDVSKNLQLQIASGSKEIRQMQDTYTNTLSQQVWTRLNGYIEDYSIENNLQIVFGTNGNGNIMFADDALDITNDVLEYSNSKYEGN